MSKITTLYQGDFMQVTTRSYLTAGVALFGAGAIAITPIAPPTTDIALPMAPAANVAEVDLAAFVNPIVTWLRVAGVTAENVVAIAAAVLADPAPILTQVGANQLGNAELIAHSVINAGKAFAGALNPTNPDGLFEMLRRAGQEFLAGNFQDGVQFVLQGFMNTFVWPAANLIEAVVVLPQTFDNLAIAVNAAVNQIFPIGFSLLNNLITPVLAFGEQGQFVVDAFREGDFVTALSTLINMPAVLTGALLNGYFDEYGAFTSGLFSVDGVAGANADGLFRVLQYVREAIAASIAPAPPPDLARSAGPEALPEVNADLVNVSMSVTGEFTGESPAGAAVLGGDAEGNLDGPPADDQGQVGDTPVEPPAAPEPGATPPEEPKGDENSSGPEGDGELEGEGEGETGEGEVDENGGNEEPTGAENPGGQNSTGGDGDDENENEDNQDNDENDDEDNNGSVE